MLASQLDNLKQIKTNVVNKNVQLELV